VPQQHTLYKFLLTIDIPTESTLVRRNQDALVIQVLDELGKRHVGVLLADTVRAGHSEAFRGAKKGAAPPVQFFFAAAGRQFRSQGKIEMYRVLKGFRLPTTALVQTGGSFRPVLSRTAVILTTHKGVEHMLSKTYDTHINSTESEWCSVLDGIQYAMKRGEGCLDLENDNLGVVRSLIKERVPLNPLMAEYYAAINAHIKYLEYFSVRWIPRRFNRADELFRLPRLRGQCHL
jgi:hypothetical protein